MTPHAMDTTPGIKPHAKNRACPALLSVIQRDPTETASVDWGDHIESIAGLSHAVANTYNGIKHFDRGEFPDNQETYLVSLVLRQVVRLMALNMLDPSGELIKEFQKARALWRIQDHFSLNELRILKNGTWAAAPALPALDLPAGLNFRS
jgi:hypothetical protein